MAETKLLGQPANSVFVFGSNPERPGFVGETIWHNKREEFGSTLSVLTALIGMSYYNSGKGAPRVRLVALSKPRLRPKPPLDSEQDDLVLFSYSRNRAEALIPSLELRVYARLVPSFLEEEAESGDYSTSIDVTVLAVALFDSRDGSELAKVFPKETAQFP